MKKFLSKTFFFTLPILLLAYPLDYFISKYLSESNYYGKGETKVWKDIYTSNVNTDIAIYGSSRAWIHINPQIIEDSLNLRSYNLGIDGHNFWLQYFRHKELIKHNEKPKYIVLSLDMFTFQKRTDLYNYEQFLPFILQNKDINEYTSSYFGFSYYDKNLPLVRYLYEKDALIASIKSFTNLENAPARNKGYMGFNLNWNYDFDIAKSKFESYKIELDSSTINLFEQFVNECKIDKIKLILVYSPEYIEGQFFVKNREEVISKFKYFSKKYNLTFIDYSNDEISRQKKYFYNASHLNKKGSTIFTKKLCKDLKVLLIK